MRRRSLGVRFADHDCEFRERASPRAGPAAAHRGARRQPDGRFQPAGVGRLSEIENAGVSGDTSQGGLDRLDWSVAEGVAGVILELGANDALRGIDPGQTLAALDTIITRLKERRIAVLLAGMRAPPNMGPDYVGRFDAIFAGLAQKHGLVLYPFFLDGVAGRPELNQRDGIHPTAEGVGVIVQRMLPSVERFLDALAR
jgi:acyl-CoA thioesterase I